MNSSNILVDPTNGNVTALLDWEFASFGFDDANVDYFLTWFDDDAIKEKIKKYIEEDNESSRHVKNVGKEVRRHFYRLNAEASQLAFYVSSWFFAAKQRGDTHLEVRRNIESEANLVCELIDKTPLYLEMLRKFR